MTIIFGLDVGGTNIKSVAATPNGRILARRSDATPRGCSVKEAVQTCIAKLGEAVGSPEAIGIAVPGLIAPDRLSLADLPRADQDLAGVNWQKYLDFHRPIPMINDAQAALLGERWLGAARGFDHVIMLTLGTGVGGAAICDGRMLRGWLGRAGAIGLTSLDAFGRENAYGCPGALEEFVSDGSIAERTTGRFQTTVELLRAVDEGDQQAADIWARSVRALAAGIASAINMLDPQRVIIGGGIARAGDRLFVPLQEWLDRFEWQALPDKRVGIAPAELGDTAGSLGAVRLAEEFAHEALAPQ